MNMGLTCIISSLAQAGKAMADTVANATKAVANHAPDSISKASETLAEYVDYEPDHPIPNILDVFKTVADPELSVYESMTIYSICFGVAVVVVFAVLSVITHHIISNKLRDGILKVGFFVVWLYGFVVYDVGMCTGQYISLLTNAPMAIIYAFKIFLFDSDVSEIHEIFHKSWFYSMNFALVHFFAAVISTLFLIKYFGFNIMASFRMWWAALWPKKRETYVFWGFNEATVHLVEDIKKELGKSPKYRIIIVRTGKDDNEAPSERTGFARIFDFLAMPTSELERLQNVGCLTASSYSCMAKVNVLNGETNILGTKLKLRKLKWILKHRTCGKLHMFFLSDNEKDNLHNVSTLLHDKTIQDYIRKDPVKPTTAKPNGNGEASDSADDSQKVTDDAKLETGTSNNDQNTDSDPKELTEREVIFYCLARYNSVHRVIEDQNLSDKVKVRVVDSSHINVQMIELDEKLQPVNFVTVEKDGSVSSPFHALVVGFSEVGQDSVQFLYEFGAFVKHGSDNTHVERSDFHLDVIDKNMADLAGTFVANAPALKVELPFLKEKEKSNKKNEEKPEALIALHEMDCRSVEFYLKLREDWIKTLNYVVIATENDELNLSLGVRIFKLATRYRDDLNNLCILVRAHDDEDGLIREIAEHYNRLWAAQMAVENFHGKEFAQNAVLFNAEVKSPIHIFGLDKKIFTYKNIIDDSLEKIGIEYKERYEASSDPEYEKPKDERHFHWYTEMRKLLQIPDEPTEQRKFYPTLCGIQTLRRKQGQDIANSLHATTKKILVQKALDRAGMSNINWHEFYRKNKTVAYTSAPGTTPDKKVVDILHVLAQTEHLRWNASHEILGCEHVEGKELGYRNEIKMQHTCITSWQNLDEITKSYDYNVVDVTLGVIDPGNPIK